MYEDPNANYGFRKTSRGEEEYVNKNSFDKKTLYREWTRGQGRRVHSRIHGSNSPEETDHDLTLLFGMSAQDFIEKKDTIPECWEHDIVGSTGWDSLQQLFYILNHTCKYAVLRNFEGLPGSFHYGEHEDIDILADNYENIVGISNSVPVFNKDYRVQCLCNINGHKTQFDFRYIGDGYYDYKWEKAIIDNRIKYNGIYVPNDNDYSYMLLYHALIHKRRIADDYTTRLNQRFGQDAWNETILKEYLDSNGYKYTEPYDLSVYFNNDIAKTEICAKRKLKYFWTKTKHKIKQVLVKSK